MDNPIEMDKLGVLTFQDSGNLHLWKITTGLCDIYIYIHGIYIYIYIHMGYIYIYNNVMSWDI